MNNCKNCVNYPCPLCSTFHMNEDIGCIYWTGKLYQSLASDHILSDEEIQQILKQMEVIKNER